MQVGHETPRIIRFTYRQEKGDPGYGSCRWADFDFDTENYVLHIASDCGYYGYGWTVTKSESFLTLMSRIGDDYLLNKLCGEPRMVDWERSKEEIIYALNEMDLVEYEKNIGIKRLEDLADEYDMESDIGATTRIIEEWNEEYFQIPDVWEYVQTDYTGNQKKIAEVFREHIQPAIRAFIQETCPLYRGFNYDTIFCGGKTYGFNNQDDAERYLDECCHDAENCKLCPQYRLRETKKDTLPVHPEGWISVKDRMPESSGEYLCWFGKNVIHDAAIATYFETMKAFGSLEYDETYPNVTHWMPLPEPPK